MLFVASIPRWLSRTPGAQAGSEGRHATKGIGIGGMDSIRNMHQMLPPLMSTINEQTGSADISYIANIGGLEAVVRPRKQSVEHD